MGEYVVEIAEVLAAALPKLNAAQFADFAMQNQKFMATTRRRATSYELLGLLLRSRFPTLQTCPAIAALNAIEPIPTLKPHS